MLFSPAYYNLNIWLVRPNNITARHPLPLPVIKVVYKQSAPCTASLLQLCNQSEISKNRFYSRELRLLAAVDDFLSFSFLFLNGQRNNQLCCLRWVIVARISYSSRGYATFFIVLLIIIYHIIFAYTATPRPITFPFMYCKLHTYITKNK